MKSNLQIKSNLMIDDGRKKVIQCVPGYLLPLLGYKYRDHMLRLRLSSQQMHEYDMTILCLTCGRPCAGTCQQKNF